MRKAKVEDISAWRAARSRKWTATAVLLAMAVALPLWAQQSRIYRDGNSWVEEVTGTLPPSHQVRITTDLGSVQVQGSSPRVTYVIRKRSYTPSEEVARRQFEQMRISTIKNAEGTFIEGRTDKQEPGAIQRGICRANTTTIRNGESGNAEWCAHL